MRARNILGELETGPRRRGIGIDGVIEHAEAVLIAQALILAAHVGLLAHFERQPQRVERRPPLLALAQQRAEERKLVGLAVLVGHPLIGDIGRGRGAVAAACRALCRRRAGFAGWCARAAARSRHRSAPRRRSGSAPSCRCENRSSRRPHRRRAGADRPVLTGVPASALIWASSSTALLARSSLVKAFSAAEAGKAQTPAQTIVAAARNPARKPDSIAQTLREAAIVAHGGT